jgi:proline racemase
VTGKENISDAIRLKFTGLTRLIQALEVSYQITRSREEKQKKSKKSNVGIREENASLSPTHTYTSRHNDARTAAEGRITSLYDLGDKSVIRSISETILAEANGQSGGTGFNTRRRWWWW